MVGLFTDPVFYTIGTGDFLHAFFSTIAYRLENNNWGGRFPVLMNDLYNNGINYHQSEKALAELKIIANELSTFSPDKVVWNIEDLSQQPPWKNNIAETITHLGNYFITSDGKDLIETFRKALKASIELENDLIISSL